MRLLLDTHVVLWWLDDSRRLGVRAKDMISDSDAGVFVSGATACEIAQKAAIGKLRVPNDFVERIAAHDFTELPITLRHGMATKDLPLHHKDPFDRLLIAQARCEGLTLVTADRQLSSYDVPILDAAI